MAFKFGFLSIFGGSGLLSMSLSMIVTKQHVATTQADHRRKEEQAVDEQPKANQSSYEAKQGNALAIQLNSYPPTDTSQKQVSSIILFYVR